MHLARATLIVTLLATFGSSCSKTENAPGAKHDKAGAAPPSTGGTLKIHGAGASFPAPLYARWIRAYTKDHPHLQIDYQSTGSGSGIKAVIDKTVDFGASDAAMSDEEIARVQGGVQLLPVTAGSIVLTYNVPGLKELKLSREAYANIFLGKVKKWNDPAIATVNPGVKLPNEPIRVIVRADSSGTTYVFTQHLSAINAEFAKSPGVNKMPNWPVGTRSKGNEGITASIETTPYSLGYIEYGYAKSQNLAMAALENKSGKFIAADTTSGQAALAGAELPDDMVAWNSDPESEQAYPIVTYTWLILYQQYSDQRKLDALRGFIKYALTDGQATSEELGYIPLPKPVSERVLRAVENVRLAAAQ